MPLYQLTNWFTHARAVVIAPDEHRARELRPDDALWSEHDKAWMEFNVLTNLWQRALVLSCWPDSPEHVAADLLAHRVEEPFNVRETVVCFNGDESLRETGEGPAAWFEDDTARDLFMQTRGYLADAHKKRER